MTRTALPGLLTSLIIMSVLFTSFTTAPGDYSRTDDGVVIRLKKKARDGARLIQLRAVTDNIIHVTATPRDSFRISPSLMIEEKKRNPVKWDVKETNGTLLFSTPAINATVSLETGDLKFTDKANRPILTEGKERGRIFSPVTIDGETLYKVSQRFNTEESEAFYGLGQHQSGVMNYKGTQVDLSQFNTEVAVPFLLSSKGYGILWDNYAITKVMDCRSYEPMSSFRLFNAEGVEGWLTAKYLKKETRALVHMRPESEINYEFLPDMKKFPDSVKLDQSEVIWEGQIQSDMTGEHQFLFRYAGYARLYIDGKLYVDRWRQSWNPGTTLCKVPLQKGKRHIFRIEWNPDGSESFISCKWLRPQTAEESNEFGFESEAGESVDYYFVYGKTQDEVISGYRELTGKAPVMPKWAFGLWQSRERYKTQDEILETISEFRKRKIPIDNIVLDWSYWEQDKWGSQDFDTARFPNAASMVKTLHEKYNAHFMISVWPKFYEGIKTYDTFEKNGWLYKRNIAKQQRDWIGKGFVSTFYDAFNPRARDAFWDLLNQKLFSKGVDAWWMDATEPDIHSNATVEERKKLMGPTAIGSSTRYFNAFPLQNAAGIYNGQRKTDPSKRVFILTRSAYAGQQRYAAATWSGDISARWHDFKDQIPAGLNFSMSGIPYWTVDIGGFAVERKMENAQGADLENWRELMTRWYQYGAFCPLFRVHGQFPFREIYNIAPDTHEAYKTMLYYDRLRYRLMPYIYSVAGQTYHHNYTIMRGLNMDFPGDAKVKNIADQYMFGPAMMINPVTDPGAKSRPVYLPAATGWYDFYTGTFYNGGREVTADAPLSKMPIFVKAGSIITTGPELQYTDEKPADTITLRLYTGADGSFNLYEDEGINYNYEKGGFSLIPIRYSDQSATLRIGKRSGSFPGMLRKRFFRIVSTSARSPLTFDMDERTGKLVEYNGEELTIKISQTLP